MFNMIRNFFSSFGGRGDLPKTEQSKNEAEEVRKRQASIAMRLAAIDAEIAASAPKHASPRWVDSARKVTNNEYN